MVLTQQDIRQTHHYRDISYVALHSVRGADSVQMDVKGAQETAVFVGTWLQSCQYRSWPPSQALSCFISGAGWFGLLRRGMLLILVTVALSTVGFPQPRFTGCLFLFIS